MSQFEQSITEKTRGNRNNPNRQSISANVFKNIDSETRRKETEKRLGERVSKLGRSSQQIANLIIQGSSDRLQAIQYDSEKYENREEQAAYQEGFYEHGNRELLGKLNQLSKEQIELIGQNDYISEVDLNRLPKDIKNNESYTQGYIMASVLSSSKPKGKR